MTRRRKTKTVRSALRARRKELYGTLSNAARATGVSLPAISHIELGLRRHPSEDVVAKLAYGFGWTRDQVLRAIPKCPIMPLGGDPYDSAKKRGMILVPKHCLHRAIALCVAHDLGLEEFVAEAVIEKCERIERCKD